jgi:hypothetical protein
MRSNCLCLNERFGLTQKQAAARAGMSERTARKYEQAGALPSAFKRPHEWATRSHPFEEDWPWVVEQLERDPALQSTTLFALLCQRHPERYRPTQDRTLRRHIARWKALHGPDKDVIFEQVHTPGERAQSDFTQMDESSCHDCRRAVSPPDLSFCAHLLQCGSGQHLHKPRPLKRLLKGSKKPCGRLVGCHSSIAPII